MDREEAWYVLRTKPKREEQVGSILQQRNVEFFLPLLKRGKPTRAGYCQSPFSPCYVFVHLAIPSDEYVRSRSAPGVISFVSFDGVPPTVPEDVVELIKDRIALKNETRFPSPFSNGQRVIIADGPFKDVKAIFDKRLTADGRSRVLIDLMGKRWRVQVNIRELTRV